MYLQNITIKNYGAIEELQYNPKFNEDGTPKPMIFVGKNGSGKTHLLSNIVHSIIELKRTTGEKLKEVEENKYYRAGLKTYINLGKNYFYISYDFSNAINSSNLAVNSFELFSSKEFNQELFPNLNIIDPAFQKDGFLNFNTQINSDIFNNNIFLYFPVDRYYQPAWINPDNSKLTFNSNMQKWLGENNADIIKSNVVAEIEKWILDVVMDRELYEQKRINQEVLVDNSKMIYQRIYYVGQNTNIMNNINTILTTIYKTKNQNIISARFGISQKNYRKISIIIKTIDGLENEISPSFSHLSSGEIMILSIFASILKEYDRVGKLEISIEEIKGIVIIDEIDLHLHSDYAKNVLPALLNMFKGIQFIITSHSPFFLLGMRDTYGDNCEFINMPTGDILSNVENFEEIRKCYNLIDNDFDKLRIHLEIVTEKLGEFTKPLIITEGKTDWKHFKGALAKFKEQGKFLDLDIDFEEYEKLDMGDSGLENLLRNIAKIKHPNKIIGMFDSDESVGKRYDKEIPSNFGNSVFGWCIPKPNFRSELKGISVEFLYKDIDIMRKDQNGRRLYFTKEFNERGSHKINKTLRVINASSLKGYLDDCNFKIKDNEVFDNDDNSMALSKNDFAENILKGDGNFIDVDISAFEGVFERIREIINISQ